MSYEIFYRKQFVKVDDNHVIPMVEAGSNNVWEADNKKRARDWNNIDFNRDINAVIVSNETLLAGIERIKTEETERYKGNKNGEYTDKGFGWFTGLSLYGKGTRGTTFGQFKGFYKNGIKQALTIEELKENGITISISASYYSKEAHEAAGIDKLPEVTFISTEHMLATVKEFADYYKDTGIKVWCSMNGIYNIDRLQKDKRQARKIVPKVRKAVTEYYVIFTGEGYFVKNTKYGYKYSAWKNSYLNKRIETEKQANSFLAKLKKKHIKTEAFTVEKVIVEKAIGTVLI